MTHALTPNTPGASRPRGFKQRLKARLQAVPPLWSAYWRGKQQLKRLWLMRFFAYDIAQTYRAMFWPECHQGRNTLAAALLFQYHKLEKGLVMPGPLRLFGVDPARAVMSLARQWRAAGLPVEDPIYLGALETLNAYAERLASNGLDSRGEVTALLHMFLAESPQREGAVATPMPLPAWPAATTLAQCSFATLAQARRSVREFLPDAVPKEVVTAAVASAQLAPSACNRQPCELHIVSSPEQKAELLAYQNGNRGFGHLAPHVAICTADEQCFFDASERHEPYIDGGLFAMSFILALRDQGVGSCCLNWCVPPANDRAVHRLFGLPKSKRIVMLIAFGYAPEHCLVPRSPRREIRSVVHFL